MNSNTRTAETFLTGLFVATIAASLLSNTFLHGRPGIALRLLVFSTAIGIGVGAAWARSRFTKRTTTTPDPRLRETSQQGCLAIRHVFPPRHPQRSLSFLGGNPMAPASFEWPLALNAKGLLEPLPFIGQIDCATIPASELSKLLPTQGVLYFFLPMAGVVNSENQKLAVHYVADRPSASWEEHSTSLLPPLGGESEAPYQFRWLNWLPNPEKHYPRSYPRIEIELGFISYGGEVHPEDPDAANGFPWQVAQARHRANLIAFHGPPFESDRLLSIYDKPVDSIWRVHDGFPLAFEAIRIVTGHLLVTMEEERKALTTAQEKQLPLPDTPENLTAIHDRLDATLRRLNSLSRRNLDEPTAEQKAEFWALLDSLLTTNKLGQLQSKHRIGRFHFDLNKWLAEAATLSAEACLNHPEAARRVPLEVIHALRDRHSVLRKHRFEQDGEYLQHQLFGRGRDIQGAAGEMSETHILLLQIGPDDGLSWQMGDNGAYQFWIKPDDLMAHHFDRVTVTFECH